MKVRRLQIAPDGTAEVLLLTDPIPRHVSLVDWGANDSPAVSWKTADPTAAHLVLRSPPSGKVASATQVNGPVLRDFIIQTLDAWSSCFDAVLATPLQPGDRAAQVQALTVQAGARIAAALKILGPAAAVAASAHKAAGLQVPSVPTSTTLQGEIDRRRLRSAIEGASAFLLDASLEAAKLEVGATEAVLAAFSEVANIFTGALSGLPAGVIGAVASVATKASKKLVSKYTIRFNRTETTGTFDVLDGDKKVPTTLSAVAITAEVVDSHGSIVWVTKDLKAPAESEDSKSLAVPGPVQRTACETALSQTAQAYIDNLSTMEPAMTLAQLQALASEDPVGFLNTIKAAVEAAKKAGTEGVQVAKKFMWGETGVDPYDPSGILSGLASFQDGTALQSAIATAVGGIDANKATGTGITVAATMRKAQAGLLVAELKANPKGELAEAIKEALAEDIGQAVVETLRRALDSGHGGHGIVTGFEPAEGTDVSLVPDLPGAISR